jgi:hypothetical protein
MGTSIFIAKILGPCLLVAGIGLLFNMEFYRNVMVDYAKNSFLIFFGGIIALIVGILILLFHNVWEMSWPVIITIYGWGGLIKGIWLIVFPKTVPSVTQAYQKSKGLLAVHSIIILIFGGFLTYTAYFADRIEFSFFQ